MMTFPVVLFRHQNQMLLSELGSRVPGAVSVDLVNGPLGFRLKRKVGKSELLAKAIGVSTSIKSVVDATAGLCGDATALAYLGCRVIALEKNPLVYALAKDGLARAAEDSGVAASVAEKITLVNCNSIEYLGKMRESRNLPDVVFLDPMFPEKKKTALASKEMQLLQKLLEPKPDENKKLFQAALSCGAERIVVKRPLHAPCLGGEPQHQFKGRAIRYDMYLCSQNKSY